MIKDKIELQGRSTLDNRESYARRLSSLCIGFSLKSIADETRELEVHQSNGKKLESKIVTLSRLQLPQEGNGNKRIKEAARAINFSSTDKVLPVDALIIGALKYMELVASSSNEADRKESRMDYDDQFDDLHEQELMDIEEGVTISEPVVDPGIIDLAKHGKQKKSSSAKSGVKFGIPLDYRVKRWNSFVEDLQESVYLLLGTHTSPGIITPVHKRKQN